ncbi:MAG: hypothetical protein FGM15_09845 [Chthoniobacterales bacterium]|nr:hypothetical protein [Chthoniobacterales bacterium]
MIRHHVQRARHKWNLWTDSDRGMAALLTLLVLYVFVIYPLLGGDQMTNGAVSVSFSLILVAGIMATSHHNAVRIGIVILAGIAFASHWLNVILGGRETHLIASGAAVLFFAMQAWFLSMRVFRQGEVHIYRILGAVAVFLVLGLLWANIYLFIYLGWPNSFFFTPGTQAFEPPTSEMVYFSFVTLTTLGYGDIVAVSPMARSLVTLEGLVGQLYPAILLARLVTEYRPKHREK